MWVSEGEDFLEVVTEVVRARVLDYFKPDSCHATTRIVIDVLDYFGVPAKPIPVETLVFNADAMAILETEGMHAVAAAVQAREPEDKGGPWTIGLGVVVDNTPEGGHVVAGIPSRGVIIDGSLDQASRPIKDILLKACVIEVEDPDFFTQVGAVMGVKMLEDGHGVVTVVYTHSRHKQYLNSPNWKRQSEGLGSAVFKRVTAQAIKEVKARGVTPK